jgi:hypothetical protein
MVQFLKITFMAGIMLIFPVQKFVAGDKLGSSAASNKSDKSKSSVTSSGKGTSVAEYQ